MRYLVICVLMLSLLAAHYLIMSQGFAFTDIGSDTYYCFYPLQAVVSRQLHELHAISWSFNLGLGGYIGSLFDPLMLLTGWLPESWQLASRLPMFALRVVMAGGFFLGYLRLLHFDSRLATIGGLCYAFSSYGMLNSQWEVMAGTEFMQLAIFLFLFEKYLDTRQRWAPFVAGIAIGLGHPMGLYTFGLFGMVYSLARLVTFAKGECLIHLRKTFSFAAWCIPGLLITAPLLFPALFYMFESPRVSGNYSQLHGLLSQVLQINDRITISSELAGLFGKDLLGSGSHYAGWANYFEAPGFYIGMLPLLCIPQLFAPNSSKNERKLCVIGLIGIALYFVFPVLRRVVYGFGEDAFRFSSLWISALLLVLGLAGLRRSLISGIWHPGVVFALLPLLGLPLATAMLIPDSVSYEYLLVVLGFVCAYAAIVWRMPDDVHLRTRMLNLLIPVVALELLLFAIPSVVLRDGMPFSASQPAGPYNDGTDQALAFVRQYQRQFSGNDDFYRIDKTYSTVFLNDALVQDYPGTASYFFHATSITRFVDRMNLSRVAASPASNYISSMSNRRDVMDLVGVRYLLSHHALDEERDMAHVATVGGIHIYRNMTAHAFGTFYSSIMPESSADTLPIPQRDAFLLGNAVVADPVAVNEALRNLHLGTESFEISQRVDISTRGDDALIGTVQTPNASLLLLAMPFDRGWSAMLDGNRTNLFRADYGLSALLVPAGKHAVSLTYVAPGRRLGIVLGLSSLVLILLLWQRDRVGQTRQRRELLDKDLRQLHLR